MKPILLWPVTFPRSTVQTDLGVAADKFIIVNVEHDRAAMRLAGLPRNQLVLDPYWQSRCGGAGREVRARFSEVVLGMGACRERLMPLVDAGVL